VQVALQRAQEAPQQGLEALLLELEATALERGLAQVLAEQRVRVQELAQALGLEQVQVRALALVAQQVELQVQVQEEE
jgi:hypothetical protein